MRVLRGVVYMTKSGGPRTEPWGTSGGCVPGGQVGFTFNTDTAKLTDMVIARLGDRRDLARKSEVFIKYEAEVSSRVSDGK